MRITNMEVIPNPDTIQPEMHVTLAFPMEIIGADGTYNPDPVINVYEDEFMEKFREQLILFSKDDDDE